MPINTARVRYILCDTFGTTVDWHTGMTQWLSALGDRIGRTADWAKLTNDWRMQYEPSMKPIREGRLPYETLDVLNRQSLDKLLPEYGLDDLSSADREEMNSGWRRLPAAWPDSIEGIRRLQTRWPVGSLSNGGFGQLVDLARYADLKWDMILSTDLFQTYKPAPAVYLGAAKLLAVEPSAILMVACHNNDLEAASSAGMQTAFLQRPMEWGPGQSLNASPEQPCDVVIKSFGELASALLSVD